MAGDRPGRHLLVLPAFPGDPAATRRVRAAPAPADLDRRAGPEGRRRAGRGHCQADGESVMRQCLFFGLAALAATASLPAAGPASAAGQGPALRPLAWSSSGPFGTHL